ncbi:MAG: Maf family protein [Terriglobia bacterium]
MSLILASTSPRRKELLALLQIPFDVMAPTYVEQLRSGCTAEEQVREFARGKAQSCSTQVPDALVLGSDTLIALDGNLLGKPVDLQEARAMLQRMSGREHLIYTAVAVRRESDGLEEAHVEAVRVWMKPFERVELDAYLRTGESSGKAGAYSIQGKGGQLIAKIQGDYTAAVGLPLRIVATLLRRHGVSIPTDMERLYQQKHYPNWTHFNP